MTQTPTLRITALKRPCVLCAKSLQSCPRLFMTLWTVACQAPLSMGFSRQEFWSGLPWPPPRDLPDPRIKPASPVSPALADGYFITSATCEALGDHQIYLLFFINQDTEKRRGKYFGSMLYLVKDIILRSAKEVLIPRLPVWGKQKGKLRFFIHKTKQLIVIPGLHTSSNCCFEVPIQQSSIAEGMF